MQLRTIKDIFHKELNGLYPKEEVDSFFHSCVEHYLGMERFVLALRPDLVLTKEEESPFFAALAQLRLERPIQYILGVAHFMGLGFKVNENVLIPRPETEELVQWILDDHGDRGEPLEILDIGTGSGCIAISLAKQLPRARVHALDISEKALEVAGENAAAHGVDIHFMQGDILGPWDLGHSLPKLDLIVSNPPYVRELEKEQMRNNVKEHEPALALFVPDGDPLVHYDAIARHAHGRLGEAGQLYLEINQFLGKGTKRLLGEHNFSEIELRKDLYGNDRMLKAKKK